LVFHTIYTYVYGGLVYNDFPRTFDSRAHDPTYNGGATSPTTAPRPRLPVEVSSSQPAPRPFSQPIVTPRPFQRPAVLPHDH